MEDVFKLAELQARLLDRAASLLKPGGRLVYATCSLEREEGERQVERFLARHQRFRRVPVEAREIGGEAGLIGESGDLRCLPSHWPDESDRLAGSTGSSRRGLSWTPVEPITLGCTALGRRRKDDGRGLAGRNGGRCPDRHAARAGARRMAAGATRLLAPFGQRVPRKLLIAPQDLRTADPTIAGEIYAGHLKLAGMLRETHGRSPFELPPPSLAFAVELTASAGCAT